MLTKNASSLKRMSSPMIILKKLAKSTNSETYDFKSPKLVARSNKTPLKIKTSIRASIENLLEPNSNSATANDLLMTKLPFELESHRVTQIGESREPNDQKDSKESTMMKESKVLELEKKDIIEPKIKQEIKDLKDQKDISLIIESPLNSYKGSFLEGNNTNNTEGSPLMSKERGGSFNRGSTFEKTKTSGSFLGKTNNRNMKSSSKENSPGKVSIKSTSSKEKKVFNFQEKNSSTPNSSFLKEKNDKECKPFSDG